MPPRPLVRSYEDSAVVIAGGTAGVGLATARGFVAAGVRRVALLGRDAARGEAARSLVLDACPEAQVEFVACDAQRAEQAHDAVHEAHRRLGGLDVLVCSTAGSYRPKLLHRTALDDVEAILLGQALPPMLLVRAALPLLREQGGGSIVTIASDAAKVPTPGEAVLGAGMAAIVMFSRVTALEGKRDGIRVNVLTPSLIAGTATAENVLADGFSRRLFEKAASQADLGVADPDDLAALAVFLGGPAAARLTGQAISVNGGISVA